MTRESRVHEAAARWFLRLNGKRCTAEDRESFRAWRSEPANAAAYAAVEAAWAWSGNAAEPAEVDSLPEQARTRAPARALPLAAAAACIVAAALVAGWLLGWPPSRAPDEAALADAARAPAAAADVYGTGVGERSTVTFSDGSLVFLNTSTRLRAELSAGARHVVLLEGQALFEVAHDPERPFVVTAGEHRVTAIGTAFDVRLDQDRLQVTLIEGRVSVENPAARDGAAPARTELEPGQQLIDAAGGGVEIRTAPVKRMTSWREGRLIFENEPLSAAVEEMNRYSTTRIRLADPALGELRISGVFRTGQSRVFAEALAAYFPLDASLAPGHDEIVLSAR